MTVLLTLPRAHQPTTPLRARALVFEDPRSRALQARVERLAPSDVTILVTGETGTGKEIVARYVHELSRRVSEPFLAVNCGAFSETLIESELFGHVRGSFTGAIVDKAGWFEAANGGTLFLDEVGDLSPVVQVKLLRVLQEREVVRLGSHRPVPVDVRLVAATNVNLEKAVAEGRFRADLYYRLVVARVAIAPLRDRPGDILPLARYFAAHCAEWTEGASAPRLTPEAEQSLLQHPWPGNIRELENVMRQALLVCRDGRVTAADLSLVVWPTPSEAAAAGSSPAPAFPCELEVADEPDAAVALRRALLALYDERRPSLWKAIEEAVFRTAYEYAASNQLGTARLLGLTRSIVRARLLEFGALSASREASAR